MNIIIEGDQSNEVNSLLFVKRSSLLSPTPSSFWAVLSRLLNTLKSFRVLAGRNTTFMVSVSLQRKKAVH